MNIEQAADYVNRLIPDKGRALAMHIVAKETGFSTTELAKEFARRRAEKKKAKEERQSFKQHWQSTLPDWVLKSKEWDD